MVDTSGSMDRDDRLGLVKESRHHLVDELDEDDTVAIVIYDDNSAIVLEPTSAGDGDIHGARSRQPQRVQPIIAAKLCW